MKNQFKLTLIKIVHTAIWVFFNIIIFYMLYAVTLGEIDRWLWIGYALISLETIVLLLFRFFCPLTVIARKYSDSTRSNFDIYLPNGTSVPHHNATQFRYRLQDHLCLFNLQDPIAIG